MIDNRYKEARKYLKNLFDKYGIDFTMACGYLMEHGFIKVREMTDEDFEKIKEGLYEEEREARAKGYNVVGIEFQIHIVELAREIVTKVSEMELLMFQKEMPWDVGIKEPKHYKEIIQNLIIIAHEENMYDIEWDEFQEQLKEKLMLEDEEYDDLWVTTKH